MGPHRFQLSLATRDAWIGILVGLGAPAGSLILRIALGSRHPILEVRTNAFFYIYQLVGTCAVFGVAGYFEGRRADRLRRGRDGYRLLAERDDLTELPNKRSFQMHFRRASARCLRTGETLALLLVDVDELKKINDRFGHPAGSAALVHVARALRDGKREEDMAVRWGGDEFAVLMPGADAAAARRVAQSIVDRLRREPLIHSGREIGVTATIGIAIGSPALSPDEIFELADQALYAGKQAGRNCVRTAAGAANSLDLIHAE